MVEAKAKLSEMTEQGVAFNDARLAALARDVAQARSALDRAEQNKRDWESMTPLKRALRVAQEMKEDEASRKEKEARTASLAARDEENRRYRDRTMYQVIQNDKAVLKAGSEKPMLYSWFGLAVGCLPGWYLAKHYHMGELLSLVCLAVFAFLGLIAGGAFFDSQFVVDEYNDGSVFRR